jgi:hypothetical protein
MKVIMYKIFVLSSLYVTLSLRYPVSANFIAVVRHQNVPNQLTDFRSATEMQNLFPVAMH